MGVSAPSLHIESTVWNAISNIEKYMTTAGRPENTRVDLGTLGATPSSQVDLRHPGTSRGDTIIPGRPGMTLFRTGQVRA